MAITGTITAAQGTQTISSSAYDQLTVTVSSGTYSVEYPIGTVIANGVTTTASYQLGGGGCRITVNTGSVGYSLEQIDDNLETQLYKVLTDAEFAILVAGSGLTTGVIYKVGTPEVWYQATSASGYRLTGSAIPTYTSAQLSAMALAGTLTPLATYVASDTGDEYRADDASTLRPINNATYPVLSAPMESSSYYGTSVAELDGSHTSLIPPGQNLNGFVNAICNGEQYNNLPVAAVVSITGSIAGTVLTVATVGLATNPNGTTLAGAVKRGHFITGDVGIPAGTYIMFDPADTGAGSTGTYKLSADCGTIALKAFSLTCANGVGGCITRFTDPYIGPGTTANPNSQKCWLFTIDPTHRVTEGHGRTILQSAALELRKRYRIEAMFRFYDQTTGAWQTSNSTACEPQMLIMSLTQLNAGGGDYDVDGSMGYGVQYVGNGPFAVNYSRGVLKFLARAPSEEYAYLAADGYWSWEDFDRNAYFQTNVYEYQLKGANPVAVDMEFFLDERAISEGGKGWLKVWVDRQLLIDYVGRVCYPAGRETGNIGQVLARIGLYDTTYDVVADNTLCSAAKSTAIARNMSVKYFRVKVMD